MQAVILQPSYLPWLGYFEQYYRSDVFIFFDDAAFDKGGWRNRNRIRAKDGSQWLTVPVYSKGRFGQLISEVLIRDEDAWKHKHLAAIRQHYGRAKAFEDYYPKLETIISLAKGRLLDLNLALFLQLGQWLGIERKTFLASSLGVPRDLGPTNRLIELCQVVGATRFYEGASGRNYIEEAKFEKAGIEIIYQDYRHPIYPQQYPGFVSHLSVIDLLFNQGESSLSILLNEGSSRLP